MRKEQAQLPGGQPMVADSQPLPPRGSAAQRAPGVSGNTCPAGLFLQLPSSCFCCPSASRRSVKVSSPISCSRDSALGSECRNITGRAIPVTFQIHSISCIPSQAASGQHPLLKNSLGHFCLFFKGSYCTSHGDGTS